MWVKEQLFVLAYKDYTFDLYDIDQLEKYQRENTVKEEQGAEGEAGGANSAENEGKSPEELNPLIVILKGLPKISP